MFNDLTDRLNGIFKKLKGEGRLSEANIKEALREVRRALLEADVNFKIVKNFVAAVQEQAIGQDVLKSLKPSQQVIKIVHDHLVSLMGEESVKITLPNNRLNKIMLVGLQGSGKTTTCAKLAQYFRKKSQAKPHLAACDIYRPAAVHQLQVLGKTLGIPVTSMRTKDVGQIAKLALQEADKANENLLIIDTAGRLHIDSVLMEEVAYLKDLVKPDYIFFVADAMTGQDAVTVAREFHDKLDFDGVILTKMDGDSRGGAALSIKAVTGKPVAFVGMGEKTGDLEEFHPERMASRILGMGDVLTLIEKAQEAVDAEEAEKMAARLKKNLFTFNDFLKQLHQLKRMGPLESILKMIPGLGGDALKDLEVDEGELGRVEAIIYSMTPKEREYPEVISGSRRARIAAGSGSSVQEVNRLLKQFNDMKKMLKQFNDPKKRKRFPFAPR